MNGIRLHQLEGFYHVAQTGNYTKAAEAFSYPIGQPAVYQQVKQLQDDLGVPLVRQAGPRRTELTPEGRVFFEFIAPFFNELPNVVARLRGTAPEPLKLAADQFLAMEALPQSLLAIRKDHPQFTVQIIELASQEIVNRVMQGQADAGLLYLADVPRELSWTRLGRIGAALMVPIRHPLAKGRTGPKAVDILKYPLITYESRSPSRLLTEKIFRQFGSKLQIAAEVTFSQTMHAMVQAGYAPAFVPFLMPRSGAVDAAALPKVPGTKCFNVSNLLKGGALSFGLLFRPGIAQSPTFQLFSKTMLQNWA